MNKIEDFIHGTKKHPLTLVFPNADIEKEYQNNYIKKILNQIRLALLVAIVLYGLFAFLDPWIIPESKSLVLFIRFGIAIPLLLLVLGLSFTEIFTRYWKVFIVSSGLIAGSCISVMVTTTSGLGSFLYPTGLLLAIMWVSVFIGLPFIYSIMTCIMIFLSYVFVALVINIIPTPIFLNNCFFLVSAIIIGSFANFTIEKYSRNEFVKNKIIEWDRSEIERLLLNILPRPIAEDLKRNSGITVHSYESITILFADIVGFTEFSAGILPNKLVTILNEIFSIFDDIIIPGSTEKIKTIGDAYMLVGGLPEPCDNHVELVADVALNMQHNFMLLKDERKFPLNIRIGIHTGPAVAGVIGTKKFSYDVWGDSVNIASRMESQGVPGEIQVSETSYQLLKHQYIFEERGIVDIRGKGQMKTYFLRGRNNIIEVKPITNHLEIGSDMH